MKRLMRKNKAVFNGDEFAACSVEEFAKWAQLGQSTVWKAIRNGQLMARKCGRRTLILKEDGERYLNDLPLVPVNPCS